MKRARFVIPDFCGDRPAGVMTAMTGPQDTRSDRRPCQECDIARISSFAPANNDNRGWSEVHETEKERMPVPGVGSAVRRDVQPD